jgi:hypothetical protein
LVQVRQEPREKAYEGKIRADLEDERDPLSKLQIPNSKLQRSSKHPIADCYFNQDFCQAESFVSGTTRVPKADVERKESMVNS